MVAVVAVGGDDADAEELMVVVMGNKLVQRYLIAFCELS